MRTRVLAVALLACASSPAPLAAQTVLLRLAPPLGQVSHYSADMVMRMRMEGLDEIVTNMRMQMRQTVTDIENDVRTLKIVIDSMVMEGAPGMAGNAGAQVQGMTMTVQMDPRGRPVAFEMPEGLGGPMGGLSGGPLAQGFAQVLLPEDPVAPGAEWVDTAPMDLGQAGITMQVEKNLRYRFDGLEVRGGARLASLSVTGTIMMVADAPIAVRSDGAMQGTMVIDLDAGRFVSYAVEMDMDMDMPAMATAANLTMTMEGTLVPGS